jgi:tetratricopeptide (TPR) repeat protein
MMMVEHVIMNNKWERPVYFSSNPADKSRLELGKHTRIVGQAFEVVREEVEMGFDWPETERLMDSVFQYRSYNDPMVGLDDNAVGLAVAFPERMFVLADHHRRSDDTTRWEYWLSRAQTAFPAYNRTHEQLAAYWSARGDSTRAQSVLAEGLTAIGRFAEEVPENRLYWYFQGQMAESNGQDDLAEFCVAEAFRLNPNDGLTYNDYVALLVRRGRTAEAARAAARWLTYYPGDQRARQLAAGRK